MHPQCVTWHMLYIYIYIAANGLSDTMVGGYFVVSPCLSYLVMGFPVSPPKLGARDPEAIWLDTISVALRWIKIYKNHLSYKNIVLNRVQQPKNDQDLEQQKRPCSAPSSSISPPLPPLPGQRLILSFCLWVWGWCHWRPWKPLRCLLWSRHLSWCLTQKKYHLYIYFWNLKYSETRVFFW